MCRLAGALLLAWAMALLRADTAAAQEAKAPKNCPPDAVVAGTLCMDMYEVSVWRAPSQGTVNEDIVTDIRHGKATVADLAAASATQLGIGRTDDYAPCADGGQNCADIFAVSLAGVPPSANITWFQAQAACKNSGKRLPSDAEWLVAAAGTPDGRDNGTTSCNADTFTAVKTGSRSSCKSAAGAFDMVGNVAEWVADRVPPSPTANGAERPVSRDGHSTRHAPDRVSWAHRAGFFIGFRCAR